MIDATDWHDGVSVSSRIPLHAQLLDILIDHLSHDGYLSGALLPTERSLVRHFNLGRITVRRALDALVAAGYAQPVPGTSRLRLQSPPSSGPQPASSDSKVEMPQRRQPSPRRIPICVSLGDGWWADAFAAQLQQQADTSVKDRRFRLIPVDATRTLQTEVRIHRAQGVIIRSPADPGVIEQVESLARLAVPVVTVGSDLPAPNRTGYAGANLVHAGDLVAGLLLAAAPAVEATLILTPDGRFYADQEIEQGFRRTLRRARLRVVTVSSRDHDHQPALRSRLAAAAAHDPAITAVFALGAGAGEALDALRADGRTLSWAGAWGRSPEHQALLQRGALDVVAGTPYDVEATLALHLLGDSAVLGQPGLPSRPQVEFWDAAPR